MKKTLREWAEGLDGYTLYIIDDWEKRGHGDLPVEEAVEKYGDCMVEGSYTSGSFKIDVWIDIPGMHIGYISGDRLTIPGAHYDEKLKVQYAIFKGKRSGRNITVVRNGDGPYEIYVDSTGWIEYVTDCGKNPHYVWHGKKLTAESQAAIWALRDEV